MGLYENVKKGCYKRRMSIYALEDKLHFSRGSIYKWDINIPSIAKVKMVADELGMSLDEMVEGVDFRHGKSRASAGAGNENTK